MISGPGSSHCCRVLTGGVDARSGTTRQVVEGIIYRYRCGRPTGHGTGSTHGFWQKQTRKVGSTGQFRWTRPLTEPTSTGRTFPTPQGELPNYKKLFVEPADHAIGRSRGGLSTKIHHASDGKRRPLAMILGPGQAGDSPMFPVVMDQVRVRRLGGGRARTRPDAVMGDKAYSS